MYKKLLLLFLLAALAFFVTLNIQLNSAFLLSESRETSSCSNFISTPYLADPNVFDEQDKELEVFIVGEY